MVVNQQTGSVSGASSGVYITDGVGRVTNNGIITGSSAASAGVNFSGGGLVTNLSKGTISGIAAGVQINGSTGTVFNAGTIEAPGAFAVRLAAGHANRVAMAPGAVFDGTVDGGNVIGSATVSALELASAAGQGTLSALGSQFIDFAAVTVDAHANWTISSAIQNGQRLTNDGTLAGVVLLAGGASVTNTSSGAITGSAGAIYAPTSAVPVTIANAGSIAVTGPSGTAVNLDVAASISNTGTILGANVAR